MTKNKFLVLSFSFALCALSFTLNCFAADEPQKFPFVGKVSQDNINIRAGNNQNFEALAKANSGNMFYVEEESYGWYKVRLPKSAHCYVAKAFVEKKENEGMSKANNLNLRARPDKESSILGQIKKDNVVTIVADDNQDWYEILPLEGCYGWISAELIGFYSYDMTKLEEKINPPVGEIKAEEAKIEKTKPEKPKRRFLWW